MLEVDDSRIDVALVGTAEVNGVALAAAVDRAVDTGRRLGGSATLEGSVVDEDVSGFDITIEAAAVDRAVDLAATDVDVGAVDHGAGDGEDAGGVELLAFSHELGGRIAAFVEGVGAAEGIAVDGVILIVVAAVGTAEDIVDHAAADVDTGVFDFTCDVVAAKEVHDTACRGLADIDKGGVFEVGHVTASIHRAGDGDVGAVDQDIGADIEFFAVLVDEGVVADVGEVLGAFHVTGVAAAVDVLDGAFFKFDGSHDVGHEALVVAAEDSADGRLGGRSGVDEDGDTFDHSHAVTATEDGVDATVLVDADVDVGALLEGLGADAAEGAGLDLFEALHTVAVAVVVGAVTAAEDTIDLSIAADFDVGGIEGLVAVVEGVAVGGGGGGQGAEGLYAAALVVAGVEVAVDGAADDLKVAGAEDGGHVAAAIDIAVDGAAADHELGGAVVLTHAADGGHGGAVAHVGQVGAAIDVAVDMAAADLGVGAVMRGNEISDIFLVEVEGPTFAGRGVVVLEVDAADVAGEVVAMVVAVGAAEDVAVDHSVAGDEHVGAVAVAVGAGVCIVAADGADVAADVAAAVDGAGIAAFHVDEGGVGDVGLLASAIEVVDAGVAATGEVDVGAAVIFDAVDGEGVVAEHLAGVAAAIDGAKAAAVKVERGQDDHVGLVVAAEEGMHVIAVGAAHPVGVGRRHAGDGGQGGVLVDALRFGICGVDGGGSDGGAVAAGEGGVDHAAGKVDLHDGSLNLVAAAEEVADAVVAAEAGGGAVGRGHVEVGGVVGASFADLGAVDVDGDLGVGAGRVAGAGADGAAIVVAAEGRDDGAAADVDLDDVGGVGGDVGRLGAAEEAVDLHEVLGLGDRGAAVVGHVDDDAGDGGHAEGAGGVVGQGVAEGGGGAILVEAVAAAVDGADLDAVGERLARGVRGAGAGGVGADSHRGGAGDGAADVVASEDGAEGVGVVDGDDGVAGDVGHAAAAVDGAADGGTGVVRLGLDDRGKTKQRYQHDAEGAQHSNSTFHILNVLDYKRGR